MDWNEFWNTVTNFFTNNVWNIVLFFAVLILGVVVIKITINIIRRIFAKSRIEKIAQQFIVTTIKVLLYLVLVLALLAIIGVQITGIVTALSALLLAVGMALESNIANLANGIVIVATKMFKKGDYISVDGVEGSIIDINFLFTTLSTPDNKRITIPNSTIVNSSVTNAGANPRRRVEFTFSVAYDTDVELVKKLVTDVMKSNGSVYLDPAPFCRLKTLGSSSIDFFSHCWCDTDDYWDVYYYVVENVYNEFKRNGISIPYSQLEVRSRTDDVVMPYSAAPLPERVEKVRVEDRRIDLENASFSEVFGLDKKKKAKSKKDRKAKPSDRQAENAQAPKKSASSADGAQLEPCDTDKPDEEKTEPHE